MSEKHSDRKVPGVETGLTIAAARAELFRRELDSFYDKHPGLRLQENSG
jgi:hypothetical protein